jgi:hypothetical protein
MMCNGSRCTIGKGVLDASCAPGEATCRDLIQLVGDLYRHHAVEHENISSSLACTWRFGPDVSGGERTSPSASNPSVWPLAKRKKGPSRGGACMSLARGQDKRRAHGSSCSSAAGQGGEPDNHHGPFGRSALCQPDADRRALPGVHCTAHSGSSCVLAVAPDMRAHVAVAPASLSSSSQRTPGGPSGRGVAHGAYGSEHPHMPRAAPSRAIL